MAADERKALDIALDALTADAPVPAGTIADEDLTMLRRLHAGWQRPTPDPRFVHRLRSDLLDRASSAAVSPGGAGAVLLAPSRPSQRVPTSEWHEPWRTPSPARPLRLAFASLATCLILIAVALARRDDDRPGTIPAGEVASPPASNRAVLLVIDVSGSMSYDPLGGTSKIEIAKQAAQHALVQLDTGDWFGLLAFNDQQTWVVALQPLAEPDPSADDLAAIGAIQAEGGTELYPALAIGIEAMEGAEPAERQIVILSDGKSRTGTRESYAQLVQQAADDRITISTVAIGADADTDLLQLLAELGGGRYHYAERPDEIPVGVALVLDIPWAGVGATPAPPSDVRSTPIEIRVTVDGDGLLAGDNRAETSATEQLEAALDPLAEAGCRIGFVITEATAPDIATGNQIADAVNALLQREFSGLTGGAGFYSFANIGDPAGSVTLLAFPNADCEVT